MKAVFESMKGLVLGMVGELSVKFTQLDYWPLEN